MKTTKIALKSLNQSTELFFEEEMHELADAVIDGSQKSNSACDPFEDYIDLMRTKIHSNPHIFRSRLTKGYSALLHALQDVENSQEKSP